VLDPQQTDPPASGASPPAGAAPSPSGGGGVNRRHLIAVAAILLVAVGCAGLLRWVSGGDEAASTTPLPTYERPRWIVEAEKKRARQAEEERTRRAAVTSALEKQSAALLQGDRARFVAAIDPGAKRVAPWLTERFDSLRAMRVARWSPEVTGFTRSGIGGVTWRAKVTVNYCLVDPRCIPMTVDLHTMWELGPNTTRLTEVWADPLGEEPPPWSTSRLEAVVG